jgi:hypothetical protein
MTAMRKAFEAHFHTEEQVREYVQQALRVFHYVDVPDDLREETFRQALNLLAQKQVTFEAVAPTGVLLNQRPQG